MPDLLFATRNPWKVHLFTPSFELYGFRVESLGDLTLASEPPVETGLNAVENALAKARYFHSSAHPWVFGDDAGLEIDALHGEPGLKARRWNDYFTDDVDDQTWLDYLLFRLREVPPEARTASFVSGWALVAPDGTAYTRPIRWPFRIAASPIRPIAPGSPISAVRICPADDLASRQAEIRAEWARWGIFELILAQMKEG
jgi:inosine/xanthosine triphosphate pyrophosphatase family protein